jgi:OOP family OmpA-OmpF porin
MVCSQIIHVKGGLMRNRVLQILYVAMIAVVAPIAASAADLAGARDPDFMQRFSGSEIVDYLTSPYVSYTLGLDPSFDKTRAIEGQLTRVVYRVPGGHTVIEVIRNYEQSLASRGFTVVYEAPFGGRVYSNNYVGGVYYQSWQGRVQWSHQIFDYMTFQEVGGVVERGTLNGHDVTVVVSAASFNKDHDGSFLKQEKSVQFAQADLGVIVDVITSAQIQQQMVTVKAADIASALAKKGFIDLYGIYFDTDKTAVKPESFTTLDEVASLLNIDLSLKLEVSGHTDNSGSKQHNMQLSQGRAKAVVDVLAHKYGIDPKRLIAKGYGDTKPVAPNTSDANKAKNRRVELRKG